MKKSTISLFLAFTLMGGMIFTTFSCKKARLNKETTTDEDNSLAESSFDDVYKNVNETNVAVKEEGVQKTAPKMDFTFAASCATITISDANGVVISSVVNGTVTIDSSFISAPFPRTTVIDFGTGCTGNDGKLRKGKIRAKLSNRYYITGTVLTITPESYYVNDYLVEGTKTVTKIDTLTWQVQVTNAKITAPDGKTVTWESTRTRKWTQGYNTGFFTLVNGQWMGLPGITDDVYEITGTASGTNREGRNFTVNITTPLRLQFCGYNVEITKGIIEIQPEDLKLRTADYGDGTCDNEGTVTVGNKTKTFKLRK